MKGEKEVRGKKFKIDSILKNYSDYYCYKPNIIVF